MIKLIRLFGLFVIICLIYGLGSAFNGNESSNVVDIQNKQSTKTVDNYTLEEIESTDYVDKKGEYQIQNDDVISQKKVKDEKETVLVNNDVSLNPKSEKKGGEMNEIIKKDEIKEVKDYSNEVNDDSQIIVEKEKNIISEEEINDDELVINEILIKENIEIIDDEYEKLKKLYRYKSGTECYNASLKVYSETYKENYKNFGCISGAYNGDLLGYRIIIYFDDGTSMYYDEAI